MGASKKIPPWADPAIPDRPWVDVQSDMPWLRERPYLVDPGRAAELRRNLEHSGFQVVDAWFPPGSQDPECEFLKELTRRLRFRDSGAGSWMAFNDRLWDFLTAAESTPYAVVIYGLDALAKSDTYHFLRCVHNLLSLTEGAGLSDSSANRQIEYFFVGQWLGIS